MAQAASILKNRQQPKWVGMCCVDSTLSNNSKFKYLLGIYGLRGIFLLGLSFNMPIYYEYAENAFFFLGFAYFGTFRKHPQESTAAKMGRNVLLR